MVNSISLMKDYEAIAAAINSLGTEEAQKSLNQAELVRLNKKLDDIKQMAEKVNTIEEFVVSNIYNDGELLELSEQLEETRKKKQSNSQLKKTVRKFNNVLSNKIAGIRNIIESKYKSLIKSSCNHCYGTGSIGYNGNLGEMPYPQLCNCLIKKANTDQFTLLKNAFTMEDEAFEEFLANVTS